MVARDGIEPPTPAFSGPRSTTELPGLSADCVAFSCAGSGAGPVRVGASANSVLQQLCQYINSHCPSQTGFSRASSGSIFAFPRTRDRTLDGNYATFSLFPRMPRDECGFGPDLRPAGSASFRTGAAGGKSPDG